MTRPEVTDARRIVVKVGSSSLTTAEGGIDPARVRQLIEVLAGSRARGVEVVLVSSGAIAAGLAPLRLKRRPRSLPAQQAAASVGQGLLVHRYTEELARHGVVAGQVLLTVDDVTRRSHYRNAHQTFAKLLELGVLPIVNENDTVATTEIRFGDNDRLAALVAHLVHADLLVLLSDVDGLYDADPGAPGSVLVPDVRDAADLTAVRVGKAGAAGLGTGGMQTKLDAARIATGAGIPVVLDRGRAGRGRAGGRAGRHPVPRHRSPPADPAAVAGARDRAGRHAAARRRCGRCGDPASRLAAGRRCHRRGRHLPRRRPGRHRGPGRRAGGPRAGELRLRGAPGAARPLLARTSSASSARRTSVRSSTATTWCCSDVAGPLLAGRRGAGGARADPDRGPCLRHRQRLDDPDRVVHATGASRCTPLLLVLLAAAAALWKADRKPRVVAAVLALVGLGMHAWWFAPQVVGDNPGPADGADRITVMNANLYEGRANAEEVVDAVRDNHVDILVLEEITPDLLAQMDAAGLAELLPDRVGEPDYMVAGTMILANQPLTDHVRLRTTFQGWEAKYGELTVLGVHPRGAGRPGRLACRPRRDPRAGRGRRRRPDRRRHERHARTMT